MLFAAIQPDDAKQIDLYDLNRLIQKGTMEMDKEELDCNYIMILLFDISPGRAVQEQAIGIEGGRTGESAWEGYPAIDQAYPAECTVA